MSYDASASPGTEHRSVLSVHMRSHNSGPTHSVLPPLWLAPPVARILGMRTRQHGSNSPAELIILLVMLREIGTDTGLDAGQSDADSLYLWMKWMMADKRREEQ